MPHILCSTKKEKNTPCWLGHRVDGDRMSAPDPEILNSSLFYMVRRVRTKLVVSVRNKLGHPTALLDPR